MPTPRHISSISGQTPAPATERSSSNGSWISGQVVSAAGGLSADYQVSLDSGPTVAAADVTGEPLSAGSGVWVVNAGTRYLIVGLR